MRLACLALALALALAGAAATADTQPRKLALLDASTGQLAAVAKWHLALRTGDFDLYQEAAATIFGWEQPEGTRSRFDELRKTVPPALWTIAVKPMPGQGMDEVFLIGCLDKDPVLAQVAVSKQAGGETWAVVASQAFYKLSMPLNFECPQPDSSIGTAANPPPATAEEPRPEARR